ncbi:MAG: hypothetical protein EXQ70_08375 [Solirubrobacterales bacterium]|nr:hypothetical protein [Solirubrobacterales bacterium]
MTPKSPETTIVAEPGSHEAHFTAVIEEPREAVYRCYLEPELLAQWWAPPKYELEFDKFQPDAGRRVANPRAGFGERGPGRLPVGRGPRWHA